MDEYFKLSICHTSYFFRVFSLTPEAKHRLIILRTYKVQSIKLTFLSQHLPEVNPVVECDRPGGERVAALAHRVEVTEAA